MEEHIHGEGCFVTAETDTEGLPEGTELPSETESAEGTGLPSETESVEETGQTTEEALTDSTELPEKTEAAVPEGLGDITLTAESGNYVITVVASKDAFPDVTGTLSLQVTQLEESSPEYQTAQRLVEGNGALDAGEEEKEAGQKTGQKTDRSDLPFEITDEKSGEKITLGSSDKETVPGSLQHAMFDLVILEDGHEIQPQIPVQVFFRQKTADPSGTQAGVFAKNNQVFHVNTETNTVEDMGATVDETGNAVIDTPHFSVFDLVGERENLYYE